MLPLYLPIAEMSVDGLLIAALGALVGFISGMFGVGGGFLMTPLLIFAGVPPAVAVASGTNQIIASSFTGTISHWRRGNVDFRMGLVLLGGGVLGSALGVMLFALLQSSGQIDLFIRLAFVVFLAAVGVLMLAENLISLVRRRSPAASTPRGFGRFAWAARLPWPMTFPKSGLTLSLLLPVAVGSIGGFLVATMGVSGVVAVPAMIYVLGMPTQVVVGTSLFEIVFLTAVTTFFQATVNHNVDVLLTVLLMAGSVFGVQWGAALGTRLGGRSLRILMAVLVLTVCAGLMNNLLTAPREPFSVTIVR